MKAKESEVKLEEGKTCSLQGLKGAEDKGRGSVKPVDKNSVTCRRCGRRRIPRQPNSSAGQICIAMLSLCQTSL